MEDSALTYDQIIKQFFKWAKNETNIRCCAIIGSRARASDHPADQWADLDFIIFADNPQAYISPGSWIEEFGKVLLTFVERAGGGTYWERQVMYEGGLEVDFTFFPLESISHIMEGTAPQDMYYVITRGLKILFDKDGLIENYVKSGIKKPPFKPPPKEEFLGCVHDFLFRAVWAAKHLRRGETWRAKSCCDSHMKDLLVIMLEWHARVKKGKKIDTWPGGRFLEQWADPKAVKELSEIYAHYSETDIWRALVNTMDLFRWVAMETAQGFGYQYPQDADKYAAALVLQLELER
jgi:aminoglycoside 6-adenylyltransferase